MAITPQQTFAQHVLQKIVPSIQGSPVASNLEWNAKKFLGQVPGETLDEATYAERTKADLAQLGSTAASGEMGQLMATLNERFGLSDDGGALAGSAPAPAAGGGAGGMAHTGSGGSGSQKDDALRSDSKGVQGAAMSEDDLAASLFDKADQAGGDLDWQNSVVDLLKLLGKDSSVGARRRYMAALGVDGEAGSSEANEALHAALMSELAANGGQLPSNVA